ncbi:MAG: hypothetical protein MHM6MM_002067 [Cercozoa sp. M6MM]
MRDVVIVSAARTPLGRFGGALKNTPAPELGAVAIRGALQRAKLPAEAVQECFMGVVLSAGCGQAPARQAALKAGIPVTTPCTAVNKVCSSGLKAVMLGVNEIRCGNKDVVVVGGMENMSRAPYLSRMTRFGARMGHVDLIDSCVHDGLMDAYDQCHMGVCAEQCATRHQLTREQQDDYARLSFTRALSAQQNGMVNAEVVPVDDVLTQDERTQQLPKLSAKIARLKPAFAPSDGTVTAANASPLSDGAAALVITSKEYAQRHHLPILAQVVAQADAARRPVEFTDAPSDAIRQAVAKTSWTLEELCARDDCFFELNEAFAAVALANMKIIPTLVADRVNVHGGALALGHPLGCSGARILVTLLNVMKCKGGKVGVAAICNGGGGASCLVVERQQSSAL